jgi:hypothetical protein
LKDIDQRQKRADQAKNQKWRELQTLRKQTVRRVSRDHQIEQPVKRRPDTSKHKEVLTFSLFVLNIGPYVLMCLQFLFSFL